MIQITLPPNVEAALASRGGDAPRMLREAALVELYRQELLTQHELAESLGMTRLESDAVLKRWGVPNGPALEEHNQQVASLRRALTR